MRAEDLILEVRDVNLVRVGQITTDRLVVTADLVDPVNATGPGTWSVSLPREDDLTDPLLEPGAGVICTHAPTGKVLWSGPTRLRAVDRSTKDTLGMVTIQGVTDEALVWRRRAYPTPTAASTAQVDGYDVRTGPAETVMRGYVLANLGPTAHVDRRVPLLTVAPDQARGAPVKASARFDPLGDLLASLGRVSGLSWRVVQAGDHLEFQVFYPADLSDVIRLSLESGTLATQRTEDGPPTVTRVIVMGQGEAADRQIVERTTPAAEAAETAWGPWARSEATLDQRQTDDPAELAQAGDKALADAAGGASVRLIPSDDLAMPWPETWNVGDLITVETGAEPVVVPVTAVALRVGPQGVKVGATIGNPPPTGPIDAVKATQAVTEKRVEALERTVEQHPAVAGVPAGTILEYAGAAAPDGYLLADGASYLRADYPDLFAAIGTTYGAVDGAHFSVPNLRGRVPVGYDSTQTEFDQMGKTGGEKAHTLTVAEMPQHDHGGNTGSSAVGSASGTNNFSTADGVSGSSFIKAGSSSSSRYPQVVQGSVHSHTISDQGGGQAHNNLQPYIVLNYIIKT